MAIYYIEDPNGKYLSEDGTRRFKRMYGKEAYNYLKTEEGKSRRFMKTTVFEFGGEEVFFEVPKECIKNFRRYERHEQYVLDTAKEFACSVIPIYDITVNNGDESVQGEEILADDSVDIEKMTEHKMELEILRKALTTLSEKDQELVQALFLQDTPVTTRELARQMNLCQTAIIKRKKVILKKLKKFF